MTVQPQTPVKAEYDSRFADIGQLPSRFVPYSSRYLRDKCFDKLLIRPLTINELKLISLAVTTKDIRNLVRAVGLVINQPVEALTVGDFFYIMMWLRVKSYTKSPVIVNWTCNADYLTELREVDVPVTNQDNDLDLGIGQEPMGETVKTIKQQREFIYTPYDDDDVDMMVSMGLLRRHTCSYVNTESIRAADLEIVSLEDDADLPADLDFPRVDLLYESSMFDLNKNPEYTKILPVAKWVAMGNSLADKLDILDSQNDLSLFDSALYASEHCAHGIRETVSLTCASCGTKYRHVLDLNPLTFFRTGK